MAEDPGDKLRQMAEHRGFKLVKSRRRKPGVGDYGRFGLTDAAGQALLGIGTEGLTASGADIENYLRSGATGKWQASANSVPDRPASATRSREQQVAAPVPPATAHDRPTRRGKSASDVVEQPPPAPARPAPKVVPPAPRLEVRSARPADAESIATLLNRLQGIAVDPQKIRRNLAAVQKLAGGLLVADLGGVVGCCGWALIQTIQRGPVGRITVLFVAEDHRRRGIATRLLAAAEQALAEKGCLLVEAMSDIQVANAHNFFRSRKFEQASYRFVRAAPPSGKSPA